MKIVIMGGGKSARYLIETLFNRNGEYEIILVEKLESVGADLASEFEHLKVLQGDGTDMAVLLDANLEGADYYIALTGRDEDNLVGCHIAKNMFHVRNTMAIVRNPRNVALFKRLKVDLVYSRPMIISDMIEQDIVHEGMRVVFSIPGQEANIVEIRLAPQSEAVGKSLQEYTFPGDTRVTLLVREDQTSELPSGTSVMHAGDKILLVTSRRYYDAIYENLVAPV